MKRKIAILALTIPTLLGVGACSSLFPQQQAPATSGSTSSQTQATFGRVDAPVEAPSTDVDWSHGRGSAPDEPFNNDERAFLNAYSRLKHTSLADAAQNKHLVDWGWYVCTQMSNGATGAQAAIDMENVVGHDDDANTVVAAAGNYLCPENHSKMLGQ
jgi:hypothetical protein